MPVGTWGYGTGATGTAAHPFSLRIQGVDYIGSVPIESITVNASVSSNATLTFTVIDPAATLPVPAEWADVEFVEHTTGHDAAFDDGAFDVEFEQADEATTVESEWIFGGVVMGVEVSYFGPLGVRMDVRCVDYGILLDVAPVMAAVNPSSVYVAAWVQAGAGVTPLGGLTAREYRSASDTGRVVRQTLSRYNYVTEQAEAIPAGTTFRGLLTSVLAATAKTLYVTTYTPVTFYAWVTPLRELTVHPSDVTFGNAPLQVRQDPTTSAHVAATDISIDYDYRSVESAVLVNDSDPTLADGSGFYGGMVNGYTIAPSSTSADILVPGSGFPPLAPPPPPSGGTWVEWYGALYLEQRTATVSGQATVVCAENFMPGQNLTVDYPAIDLDGTYAIMAVSTRFLGGTSLLRQSTIQFNGERGTVARFNRTRFARAGVTT